MQRNSKEVRFPDMEACAKALKGQHKRVGAIGFCYGGWAVFQLGSREHKLVDCISTAHPSRLTKEEIESVGVPVQILDAEHEHVFTPELKAFALAKIPTLGLPFDYQYFPGLEHGFATRGDRSNPAEMRGMERAKNAAVLWFREYLPGN